MSGSQLQSNSKDLYPHDIICSQEVRDNACNSQYYHNSLPYTQQLDSLLDQYEVKYGLGGDCASEKNVNANATCCNNGENQNLSRSSAELRMTTSLPSNKRNDKETDMRLWEMAKRIKKRNESYRTVAKILRELYASKVPVTKKSFDEPPTTSCSSDDSSNDEVDQNQEIEKARGNIKSKSAMVARQTTTATTKRTTTNSATDSVAHSTTRIPIPIVMTKLKKTVPNPVKNPELPSKAVVKSLQRYGGGIPKRPSSSVVATHGKPKRSQPKKAENESSNAGDAVAQDEAKNTVMTLLSDLLDHSTAMVMNLLSYPQQGVDPQQQQQVQKHYLNNSKQQFQIGSVLGAPYIAGIRNLPSMTMIKTPR